MLAFLGANPSAPVVIAQDRPDNPGWLPTNVELGASTGTSIGGPPTGALAAARQTDPVQAGPFSGIITQGSTSVVVTS